MVLCALAAGVGGILVGIRYPVLALIGATALTLIASTTGKLLGFISIGEGVISIVSVQAGYLVGLLVRDGVTGRWLDGLKGPRRPGPGGCLAHTRRFDVHAATGSTVTHEALQRVVPLTTSSD
jgi:hypothetical protein